MAKVAHNPRLRAVALACLVLALSGCGATLDPVLASKSDYELYREVRLASTLEGRLAASHEYLKREPHGRFRVEVERWFSRTEPGYFVRAKDSLPRLRKYLDTLPDGPHARQAAERIVELELARRYAARREDRLTEEARALEEKLADAATLRQHVVDVLAELSRHLAGIRSFGQPTSALDHELIFAFRLEDPPARCEGQLCKKTLALPYAIPDGGRLAARKALLDVVIELEDGGVRRASIAGPELFSRVGEALELRPVGAGDLQARTEAVARSLAVVENAISGRLPATRCGQPVVSPVLLERRCDGIVLRMIAAPTPETDDRIEVFPETPP